MKNDYDLTPTTHVCNFIDAVRSGIHSRDAAKQNGLSIPEANLIRKLAGLPVARHAPDITEQVIALRATGITYREIAEHLHISQSYVNHILHQYRQTPSNVFDPRCHNLTTY
ncbi:helix-turn-helix domain-containing protein [Citrobacter portucalensis]|uniref:helix-turn-helix domain-containing protein n=1 Tax=Citrobacter portucalensis TaxID=1639133 RepID=UPI00226B9F88|nr:helix-turn-helix domain-containing protein [Citrobacter portucalensis]MCX9021537.1 helix-turn-helix domain-containing protein [Citrobacter portucalensis]